MQNEGALFIRIEVVLPFGQVTTNILTHSLLKKTSHFITENSRPQKSSEFDLQLQFFKNTPWIGVLII
jgi:hypothetical protein